MYEIGGADPETGEQVVVGYADMPRPFPRAPFKAHVDHGDPLTQDEFVRFRAQHWVATVGHAPEDRRP